MNDGTGEFTFFVQKFFFLQMQNFGLSSGMNEGGSWTNDLAATTFIPSPADGQNKCCSVSSYSGWNGDYISNSDHYTALSTSPQMVSTTSKVV